VQDLKAAIIELKYLTSVIKDLRERIDELNRQIENLQADGQMMADRLRRGQ
jgi:polyhydroxyalkanoate synthesis regulator phasin